MFYLAMVLNLVTRLPLPILSAISQSMLFEQVFPTCRLKLRLKGDAAVTGGAATLLSLQLKKFWVQVLKLIIAKNL